MPKNNEYRIIRSTKRKRPALRIAYDNIIEILLPERLTDKDAEELLRTNSGLIDRLRARMPRNRPPDFKEGNLFMFLGKGYPLHFTNRLRLFDNAFLIPKGSSTEIQASMITLYKELACAVIKKRTVFFQKLTDTAPLKIRITSANTRWGSCSGRKTVSFSWKLIQCPPETIDYVIVHELSHLKEMNHSPAFWKNVAAVFPDWKNRRQTLNEFAKTLPLWD